MQKVMFSVTNPLSFPFPIDVCDSLEAVLSGATGTPCV